MNSLTNAFKALEVLTQDEFNRRFPQKHTLGEVVLGMGELVEVLKKDKGLSLRKIAEIADVSVAGSIAGATTATAARSTVKNSSPTASNCWANSSCRIRPPRHLLPA